MKTNNFITTAAMAFCAATSAFAQTWTQTLAPSDAWIAIASSADGTRLFASSLGFVYGISTNSGATWATNTQPQIGSYNGSWDCVASSADGNVLMGMNAGSIWTSTNAGVSWISNNVPNVNFFVSVALSADGTKAVAVDGRSVLGSGASGGFIYTSTNSGMTWQPTTAPSNTWSSVCSSADGTTLAAAVLAVNNLPLMPVYVSTNSGATWVPTASPTNMQCAAVASSADGRKLIVGGFDGLGDGAGLIYTSTNSGSTWISNNVSLYNHWTSVASSADGTKLVAVSQALGGIFTSTNSGNTWVSNNISDQLNWTAVTSSADGTKLAALSFDGSLNGSIWTLQTTPSPTVGITQTNGNLALSWTVPSTNFVLQQSTDLTIANWGNVTNTPLLNLTNLQYQVALPAPAGNAFFRLTTP